MLEKIKYSLMLNNRWSIFLRDSPMFTQTIDYYSYMTGQKFLVDSPAIFLKYLFREATEEEEIKYINNELTDSEFL